MTLLSVFITTTIMERDPGKLKYEVPDQRDNIQEEPIRQYPDKINTV